MNSLLPAAAAQVVPSADASAARPDSRHGTGPAVNILIVDDEPRNLDVLETVLNDPDYRLVRALSGQEALLALMADEFAVLVLDVQMPGLNGFELAHLVKERKKTARVPIIFLTAYYNEDQHILEGYQTGAVDYLHKPINPAVLRSKVAVFAELYRKARELEQANRLLHAEVAERRKAEGRLAELNASLDLRVTERTLELQDSERRLRDANERKDEFLATLAHELRNPLAPMRTAAHILKLKGGGIKEVQWAAGLMDRQVLTMARLIDDLMDVSRINRGRIELRRNPVALREVVADAIEGVQPLVQECRHNLTLETIPEDLVVDADRARLAQVFVNLLNNAAKYTDAGGTIQIRATRQDGEVAVSIRDSGIGIPSHRLEKVFEMFSQEEAALSRSRGGLGIGLSLSQNLVEMHGGTITAHSDGPGRGSEFVVRMPLSAPLAPADPASPGSADPNCRPLRILVADDNEDAAETLGTLLETLGHRAVRVHDGEAALDAVATLDPQLVLLDIGMPRLNGYEVCRLMRQQPGGGCRTLVALTGWGQARDLERSSAAGFDRHCVKPIDMPTLMELLAAAGAAASAAETSKSAQA